MTKDEIFRAFISDPLVVEKKYLTEEEADKIRITEATESTIVDILKIIINSKQDDSGASDLKISNKINKYLNKITL